MLRDDNKHCAVLEAGERRGRGRRTFASRPMLQSLSHLTAGRMSASRARIRALEQSCATAMQLGLDGSTSTTVLELLRAPWLTLADDFLLLSCECDANLGFGV